MCLFPKLIKNRKYLPNKKNGGIPPEPWDKRVLAVPIGCGECIECRKKKANDLKIRLLEEVKKGNKAHFVTLTFSTESLNELYLHHPHLKGYDLDNATAGTAVRLFLERWRKEFKKSVRHWLVTELGGGRYEHLHLHGIIWTDHDHLKIEKHWKYGFVYFGDYVSEKTINYITKYITKIDDVHTTYKPKVFTSKGLGENYVNSADGKSHKYVAGQTKEFYHTSNNYRMGLPIYYRNKVFTEEERERLWIEKLDSNKRYILGKEVDISQGTDKYWKRLAEARKKNNKLGYHNPKTKWKRNEYEQQRRNLLQEKRFKDSNGQREN